MYLDSDDEMVEEQIGVFLGAWDAIPSAERNEYFEVCCPCVDQNGKLVGNYFPDNINSMPWSESRKIFYNPKTERHNMVSAAIMKAHPMPEPEGISLVKENLLWGKLKLEYKTYYINNALRIYHQEDVDSYTRGNKYTIQGIKNSRWMIEYYLNHWEDYEFTAKQHIVWLKKYSVFSAMLRRLQRKSRRELSLEKKVDKLIYIIAYIPATAIAYRNIKKFKISTD